MCSFFNVHPKYFYILWQVPVRLAFPLTVVVCEFTSMMQFECYSREDTLSHDKLHMEPECLPLSSILCLLGSNFLKMLKCNVQWFWSVPEIKNEIKVNRSYSIHTFLLLRTMLTSWCRLLTCIDVVLLSCWRILYTFCYYLWITPSKPWVHSWHRRSLSFRNGSY